MTDQHPRYLEGEITAIAPYPSQPGYLSPLPQQGAMSPTAQQFLSEFAQLREMVAGQNAQLARLQQGGAMAPQYQAPPPVPYHSPQPAPVTYQAPQYQAPQYGQYSPQFNPTIVVHTSSAASHDDHSTGGNCWWGLAFLAIFALPFVAALVGGTNQ